MEHTLLPRVRYSYWSNSLRQTLYIVLRSILVLEHALKPYVVENRKSRERTTLF